VWPLAPGSASSYSLYEDSGVATEYQRGVYARTPIRASQAADTLRVEIGPVEGSYPGMLKTRGYRLQLPADWPPASVTVNGVAIKQAGPSAKSGWSFEGNTLTTVIPVAGQSVASRVVIEVRRAAGLTARRNELDGFAGSIARLRAAYDALNSMSPVAAPPDDLIDAMQAGDRLGYHPDRVQQEIAHFHKTLPAAQSAVAQISSNVKPRLEDYANRMSRDNARQADIAAQLQRRLNALDRAQKLVSEAGK